MKPSEALYLHRKDIKNIIKEHNATNVRVFGSVSLGNDTELSDLDLVIDPTKNMTLMDIGAIRHELKKLLGIPVDVLTPNSLPEHFRDKVLSQAKQV